MELLIFLFICGVLLTFSMALYPAWNAMVEKQVLRLIDALGTLLQWGFWMFLLYAVLAWLGFVARPTWM